MFNEVFGATQRERGDGGGGVHTAGGWPDAAIENIEVRHVMSLAPGVYYGSCGIVAHDSGSQQVPAGFADEWGGHDLMSTCRFE